MAYMTWTDAFVTGNEKIDTQHRQLVAMVNQLHEAMRIGKGNAALSTIFDQLVTYTDEHFQTEETLFASVEYPEKEAHHQEHRDLVRKALDLQTRFQGGTAFITIEVLDFLKGWVGDHILKMDMTYKGKI